MEINEFAKTREHVSNILNKYRSIRKECDIAEDGWHSRTIESLAQPFINGHFTLAIVGKVSAGKSTFINALLGCKNLLPTGHDQTTTGRTYIEYGETPEVLIKFGDGNKTRLTGDNMHDISLELKSHVSIDDEFHDLPVNDIDDMILINLSFDEIWERHKMLEKNTSCPNIDESLLKKYVSQHSKKNIAIEVHIKYPFNEELKGWRIIDTPGIGAIGGIEDRTKQLLSAKREDGNREVDAIVFLQDGSQTLDQKDTKQFVQHQLNSFTDSDKSRLFFVLTHSASKDFINYKDNKMDSLRKNYGDKIHSFTYADSLLYSFLKDLEDNSLDLKDYDNFEQPANWSDDEWDKIMQMLFNGKRTVKKANDTLNHENMLRVLQNWANFEELKSLINTFTKSEKERTLKKIFHYIAVDYLGFIKSSNQQKALLEGGLSKINKAIEEVNEKREDYNRLSKEIFKKLQLENIRPSFSFIDNRLAEIEDQKSIWQIRTSIQNMLDEACNKEKEFFEEQKNLYSDYFSEFNSNDIILESIDYDHLESIAEVAATHDEKKEIKIVKKDVWSKDRARVTTKWEPRTNNEEKLKLFKKYVKNKAQSQRDLLFDHIKNKSDRIQAEIFKEIHRKNKEEETNLIQLTTQCDNKEELFRKNQCRIEMSKEASHELIKIADNYGLLYK